MSEKLMESHQPNQDDAMRRVTVRRSNGQLDSGWLVIGNSKDANGRDVSIVSKPDPENPDGFLEKTIPTDSLNALQDDLFAEKQKNNAKNYTQIGELALRESYARANYQHQEPDPSDLPVSRQEMNRIVAEIEAEDKAK